MALLVACGSSYEPTPETEEQSDEAIVTSYEGMASLAAEKPTCQRWADENARRWGKARLQTMVKRMQSFEPAKQEAFRTKYGARIDAAAAAVTEISERCLVELRGR